MIVVGLDLSLTSTGMAVSDGSTMRVTRIKTATVERLADRSMRLRGITTTVCREALSASLVVIERPAFNSKSPFTFDRAGLWWLIVARLTGAHVPVAEVSNATLKVYATGRGRGDKDEILAAVVRRWPDVDVRNNDEADALLLCSMGLRSLGTPFEDLPQTHTRAMAAVAWPINQKGATA